MDHNFESIGPILEILEIEISNVPKMLEMRTLCGRLPWLSVLPWFFPGTLFLECCDMSNLKKESFSLIWGNSGAIWGTDIEDDDDMSTTLPSGQTPRP